MYSAGIGLHGVGNRATHNLIHDAPHQAISFGGNDHLIEFNEIHNVCFESNDAGAIYSGRDWTMRGTVIRHNYLHDITGFEGRGCVGVYLDDMYCGTEIVGNVFYQVTSAAFIGGGRDYLIENNVFVDCKPAIHVDARAMGWAKYHADEWVKEGREKGTLSGIRYTKNRPTASGIRSCRRFWTRIHGPRAATSSPATSAWAADGTTSSPRPGRLIAFEDNLLDTDPQFVDPADGDFRLKPESPAWKLGFRRIPFEKIGLYPEGCR